MSETERSMPPYEYSGREFPGGMQIVCTTCGMEWNVSMTNFTKTPTVFGRLLGLSPEIEIIYGGVSWRGDHSGCSGSWKPES